MPPVEAGDIMRPSMRPQVDGGHGVKANIYVPRCGSAAERIVASKSAIVGRPKANTEFVHCYFEGNLYGAVNLERFADRLGAAADRMRDDYPTTSVATFSSDSLVHVGEYDLERQIGRASGRGRECQ